MRSSRGISTVTSFERSSNNGSQEVSGHPGGQLPMRPSGQRTFVHQPARGIQLRFGGCPAFPLSGWQRGPAGGPPPGGFPVLPPGSVAAIEAAFCGSGASSPAFCGSVVISPASAAAFSCFACSAASLSACSSSAMKGAWMAEIVVVELDGVKRGDAGDRLEYPVPLQLGVADALGR